MRVIFLSLLVVCGMLTQPVSVGAENRFLSVIDDVPLLNELNERLPSASVFDSNIGRITEVRAYGAVSLRSIKKFYFDILPRLGWVFMPKKNNSAVSDQSVSWRWDRGLEKLVVEVLITGESAEVSFLHTVPNKQSL